MNADINPTTFARSLKSFFEQANGQTPSHGACLEFLAKASGFESYRAMRAVQDSPKADGPEMVLSKREMLDWDHGCETNPAMSKDDPRLRRYSIEIEQNGDATWINVLPEGETVPGYDGKKPALSVMLEVSNGVPVAHLSNNLEEQVLSVFSAPEGMLARLEDRNYRLNSVDVHGGHRIDGKYIEPEVLIPKSLQGSELGRVMSDESKYAQSSWINANALEYFED